MDMQLLAIVLGVAGSVMSFLLCVILMLVSWTYRTDRTEKINRIVNLETTQQRMLVEWMSRSEMNGAMMRMEKEFVHKHETTASKVDGVAETVNALQLSMKDFQISVIQQMGELGRSLNETVTKKIGECSNALLERVSDQLESSGK